MRPISVGTQTQRNLPPRRRRPAPLPSPSAVVSPGSRSPLFSSMRVFLISVPTHRRQADPALFTGTIP
ncbi:hypothetical protein SORBI_3001G513650 [Sorghum bicolor]|uniref:Uncharacterized protein n=1 Tax=Sorghum bicolor TaxID=4558 RepID=A0A1Z5SBI1_SORBI|nr:hypothetical protein SORBI_3001G513650 [Sorghum bicolor]